MTRVKAIEQEIAKLSPDELAELRDWLLDRDWQGWDQQIAKDSASGKLDKLFDQALRDHRNGKSKEI